MEFRTRIPLKKQTKDLIDYNCNILLLGSCFSQNVGKKFKYFKFNTVINPFGILFHPKAIEQFIVDCIQQKNFTENDVFFHNERWHCFNAHSSLSSIDKNELLNNLNSAIKSTFKQLNDSTHIIITLGTSWVYKHLESDSIVANCHKIPQKEFLKEILSVNEIKESLKKIVELIKSVNKKAKVIFTVSPVRHIKDGFIENQQSKAHLLSAIHKTISTSNSLSVVETYFPSYELMVDELRDYRFYAEDMIHPNQTAINYIWSRFCTIWLHPSTEKTMQEVESIQKGLAHRAFNPNSEEHQQFLKKIQKKKETLLKAFPSIKFQ